MNTTRSSPSKATSLTLLLVSEVAAMATWFATTASLSAIRAHWSLSPFHEALLTSSVQLGFVAGTCVSALLSAADRFDLRKLFSWAAVIAGLANMAILAFEPTSPVVPALRFLTGFCMAFVYPVGMKLAATWATGDLGLLIGLLVAALTLGSAFPNLLAVFGGLDWRLPILGAAVSAFLAAIVIRFAAIGTVAARAPPLRLGNALEAWRSKALRLANLGYLGHMWELYAMWAWMGAFMAAALRQRYGDAPPISPALATFAVVAVGAIGALGGGWAADRFGRTLVTIASMLASGCCAIAMGIVYGQSIGPLMIVGLIWGVVVIADSAQFSATAAELSERGLVGTMLTVQTCLGFLLTVASIQLLPVIQGLVGWRYAFATLAIGPFLGVLAMARLRRMPEARRLAGGRR